MTIAGSGKVLIVDDAVAIQAILQNLLDHHGYHTETASNGKEALDKVRTFNPHLILSDWMMPEMNGIELCVAIKKNPDTQYIYFIFLTTLRDKIEETLGNEVQADDYITKPYNQKELLARINSGIRINKLQKTLLFSMKELHKKQLELSTAEKMAALGILSAGIAHEINNPLNVISGMYQFLREDVSHLMNLLEFYDSSINDSLLLKKINKLKEECDFPFLKEDLPNKFDAGLKNIKRIQNILSELQVLNTKDYSEFSVCFLEDIVPEALLMFEKEDFKLNFILELSSEKSQINCNFNQIRHTIYNLINITLKAVRDFKSNLVTLHLITSADKDTVILKIINNQDFTTHLQRDNLFVPFYTGKEMTENLGINLSICYYLLKNHNSKIFIEKNENSGTTFYLQFPVI